MNTSVARNESELLLESETILDILRARATEQPNRIAYIFLRRGEEEQIRLTYEDLGKRTQAIAAHLQTLTELGDRVLLLFPPTIDFVIAFLGCLRAGTVPVPAYPPRRNQSMSRLETILADSGTNVALTTESLLQGMGERFKHNPTLARLEIVSIDNIDSSKADMWSSPDIGSDSLAFLQYTSGSTGKPKGVMVSHGNLMHNSATIYQCFGHSQESQGVIWLPPYHDMGLIGGIVQPLYAGFPVVLMSPIDFLQKPFRWLQAISRYRATTSGGPNFAYKLCLQKVKRERLHELDLSSWKVAFNGAETVRAETLEWFSNTFQECGFRKEAFYPCYGMAETTLIVAGGALEESPKVTYVDRDAFARHEIVSLSKDLGNSQAIVSCGSTTWLGQTVRIVDPETLISCPPNRVGEIWVSGKSVAQGYWNTPELSDQYFAGYLKDSEEGPFLRTGDLGFLREGELFITGRIKDMFVLRGRNYYPQDIELTVEKSHLALKPSSGAAFTIDIQGEERLAIVHEIEREFRRELNIDEVFGNIRERIKTEHDLSVFAIALTKPGSLPKTSSGKVRRHVCRSGFIEKSLDTISVWKSAGKSGFI